MWIILTVIIVMYCGATYLLALMMMAISENPRKFMNYIYFIFFPIGFLIIIAREFLIDFFDKDKTLP